MNTSNRVGRQAETLASEAQDAFGAVTGAAQRHAGEIADAALTHGRKMGESVGELGTGLRAMLDRSLERQPLMTVIVVAVAGLFLGGLLRR